MSQLGLPVFSVSIDNELLSDVANCEWNDATLEISMVAHATET